MKNYAVIGVIGGSGAVEVYTQGRTYKDALFHLERMWEQGRYISVWLEPHDGDKCRWTLKREREQDREEERRYEMRAGC